MIKAFSDCIENIKSNTAIKVSDAEIDRVAKLYGLTKNHIKTVLMVESGGKGFYTKSKRPIILFEAHLFSRNTNHVYDTSHPNISSKVWNKKLYSNVSEDEYLRLKEAMLLNPEDALKSSSWGLFQILGSNFKDCGCENIDDFIQHNCKNEIEMVILFLNYIKSRGLIEHLKKEEWAEFAKAYNGPAYAVNKYDVLLKAAFDKLNTQVKAK